MHTMFHILDNLYRKWISEQSKTPFLFQLNILDIFELDKTPADNHI